MAGPEGSKYYNIFLKHKAWLVSIDDDHIMGDSELELLKLIRSEGSLKAAADELKMSYRKAWGVLKKIEQLLGFNLIDRQRGGEKGGRSYLTHDGNKLLDAYISMKEEFEQSTKKITKKFFNTINK